MAVPSSPTRRQTGFQLPESTRSNHNQSQNQDDYSTRSRMTTITQSNVQDNRDSNYSIPTPLQPLPIPGTNLASISTGPSSSQSPSDLPTPPDLDSNLNLSIQPSSTSSQPSTLLNPPEETTLLKSNQQILSKVLPTSSFVSSNTNERYPSSISSSGPGSLSSSAGATTNLRNQSNNLSSSFSRNYSTSNHSNPSTSQTRTTSFGFGYSPYSTKTSGFKTSAERGLPRENGGVRTGSELTPERDVSYGSTKDASDSTRIVEGEGTGDSAGVFSFSSPYFGPQSIPDEDIDLDQDATQNTNMEDSKSPSWAAITLGQLSLGSPEVSSLSTTPHSFGSSIPKTNSSMMNFNSHPNLRPYSSSSSATSTSTSRRNHPPVSSSNTMISSRSSNPRVLSHSHHGSSTFNSGSPSSRSLPSADQAIHAAAMHRRASYNRTASGAQRSGLIGNNINHSHHHHSSLGLSPASAASPVGLAASNYGSRSIRHNGKDRRRDERSTSRSRFTSRSRREKIPNRNHGEMEFDEDATDEDEMILDLNDNSGRKQDHDDDDTEDELLDHSGSVAGSNIDSSIVGEMDTDLDVESEIGSNYGGGEDKRMSESDVNGWNIHQGRLGFSNAKSLSGYYTSTRGEYVSSSSSVSSTTGGIPTGLKNDPNERRNSRPYLLDRVNKSSPTSLSGTSPSSLSLGLSLNHSGMEPARNSNLHSFGSNSLGTSPNNFNRHHPYASSSRTNQHSASPSRSVGGNQGGMFIPPSSSASPRSYGSGYHDRESQSHSLPVRSGIGVSPLGKNSSKRSSASSKERTLENDDRDADDDEEDEDDDGDDTQDEIYENHGMEMEEENLRNQVKDLSFRGSNSNLASRSSRKYDTIRRSSVKDLGQDSDARDESVMMKRSSSNTMTDLESIISSSPKSKQSTIRRASKKNLPTTTSTSTSSIPSNHSIRIKSTSSNGSSTNCSAFISKLWYLMSNPEKFDRYITWNVTGDSIILYNDQELQDTFAKEVLPKLFKHGNVASFVRQLNLYGFQRVPTTRSLDASEQEVAISQASSTTNSSSPKGATIRQSKLSSIPSNAVAFYGSHSAFVHPNFFRDGKDRLPFMKPRSSKGKKVKDDNSSIGDVSTSPSNLVAPKSKKSPANGKTVKGNHDAQALENEESDDEDDLAFD